MKKLISVFLLSILIFNACVVFAEGFDFTTSSNDELRLIIDKARNELTKREGKAEKNTIIYEDNGLTIYLTGNYTDVDWIGEISIECVFVNETGKTVQIRDKDIYINGWSAGSQRLLVDDLATGKKAKGNIRFDANNADITSFAEVNDIEMELEVEDPNYNTLFIANDIHIHF